MTFSLLHFEPLYLFISNIFRPLSLIYLVFSLCSFLPQILRHWAIVTIFTVLLLLLCIFFSYICYMSRLFLLSLLSLSSHLIHTFVFFTFVGRSCLHTHFSIWQFLLHSNIPHYGYFAMYRSTLLYAFLYFHLLSALAVANKKVFPLMLTKLILCGRVWSLRQ